MRIGDFQPPDVPEIDDETESDWKADCMRWHGRILTGKYAHWCHEWDEMPIDETCGEFPCGCRHTRALKA